MACSPLVAVAAVIPLWLAAVVVAQDDAKRPPRESGALFERLDANKDGMLTKEEVPDERQRLFARLLRSSDKDGDGKLAREEFAAGLQDQPRARDESEKRRPDADKAAPARRPSGDRPAFDPAAVLNRLDVNNDGKVTKEEIPAERREQITTVFGLADTDNNGVVTSEEISALRRRSEFAESVRTSGAAALLRALDADGDGKLSSGEIENAATALKKLDKNGDGSLTRDEFAPSGGLAGGAFGGGGAAAMFERLRDRDANKDGKISKDELPARLQERFDALDTNKDGSLSPEELREGVRRQIGERPRRGDSAPPKAPDRTESKKDE